jgi:aminoglycoside phosphotransferase (APT) family kinase protein
LRPVGPDHRTAATLAARIFPGTRPSQAARDLAIINSVPVAGFGWINRDHAQVTRLEGDLPTYRAFVFEHLDADLALLEAHVLRRQEIAAIRRIIAERDQWLNVEQGRLAHGDFDATHIYQQDGRYTGIIDFGEIRGADPLYDLGHFLLHDAETLSYPVFPHLLAAYRDAIVLPADHEQRVCFVCMLIAIRALARQIGKRRRFDDHPAIDAIRHAINVLMQ